MSAACQCYDIQESGIDLNDSECEDETQRRFIPISMPTRFHNLGLRCLVVDA